MIVWKLFHYYYFFLLAGYPAIFRTPITYTAGYPANQNSRIIWLAGYPVHPLVAIAISRYIDLALKQHLLRSKLPDYLQNLQSS
jgi:hypothetical protein